MTPHVSPKEPHLAVKQRTYAISSGIIGNLLDHYDTALYGFLAPVIAQFFFPNEDPVVSLITTYGLMSTSLFTRPLGALFFGRWAERHGGKSALSLSLSGIAVATGLMGFIPDYAHIGSWAPVLLAGTRMVQGFFAAGESTVAGLYILQHGDAARHGRLNSYYQSASVAGILLASFAATVVGGSAQSPLRWRIPFLLGFLTSGIGLFLRYAVRDDRIGRAHAQRDSLGTLVRVHRGKLIRVVAVSSFSYITYAVPFVFMNTFVPKVASITLDDMMTVNTALLLIDMVCLPFFGRLSDRFNSATFMAGVSVLLGLTAIPMFALLPASTLFKTTCIRLWIIVLGISFLAPLQGWLYRQFKGEERYLLSGFAYALGTEIFGRSTPALCMALWHWTHSVLAPAFYIVFVSAFTTVALLISDPGASRRQETANGH